MILNHPGRSPSRGGCASPRIAFRERSAKPLPISSRLAREQGEAEEKDEKKLLCKKCSAGIAKDIDRVGRAGKHLHTFFNPAGVVYEIGCFREASGCFADGPRSNEFSWFSGYSWQISFCASCSEHLGWFFSSSEDTFFGLIVNRLKES